MVERGVFVERRAEVERRAQADRRLYRAAVQDLLAGQVGLTVAEAMWKRTPVVATAVGGIQLQIPSLAHGVTVPVDGEGDPFGAAVRMLLEDSDKRRLLGEQGRDHIRTHFLPDTQLVAEIKFFQQLSTGVMV